MLDLMRKHAKNWLMKVILGIIIIVFIFYFGSLRGKEKAETVAVMDGKIISIMDIQREYENLLSYYRQFYGSNLSNEALKKLNLKQKALDNLIDQAIILQKAEKLKINTTDEEVRSLILAYPGFQRDGVFDDHIYKKSLQLNKMTSEEFEALQKKLITSSKLENLIQEAIKVSDQEVLDQYKLQNEKINLNFIQLSPKNFHAKISPSRKDLETFYKEHENDFRIPDQMKIKYISFTGADYTNSVKVPEERIKDYYDGHKSKWIKPDGKVLALSEVRDKITAELRQLEGMYRASDEAKKAHDIIYQQENFEAYAAQNRLKINTTDFFTFKQPPAELKKIPELANMVFSLQKNEISKVISTDDGYFLLKLGDRRASYIPTFKEMEKEIAERYRDMESRRLCMVEAESIIERLKKGESLEKLSREKRLTIAETGFFLLGGAIPKLSYSQELSEALFQISEKKPYPDQAFSVGGNFLIIQFKGRAGIDMGDFAAKKEMIKRQLLQIYKMEAIRSWIEGNKASMIKEGRLEFKKDIKDL